MARSTRKKGRVPRLVWMLLVYHTCTRPTIFALHEFTTKLYYNNPDNPVKIQELDEDRSLEEYALLSRYDYDNNYRMRPRPALSYYQQQNHTEKHLPEWKQKLIQFYQDGARKNRHRDRVAPPRGKFILPEFLKKTADSVDTKKDGLPRIYLCQERKRPAGDEPCCVGKQTECFTDGGCFCDESCQEYDDCCPDYNDTCNEILSLCLINLPTATGPPKTPGPVVGQGRCSDPTQCEDENARLNPMESTEKPHTGGNDPGRLAPNKCCGQRAYNDGDKCCCNGELVSTPCDLNPCN